MGLYLENNFVYDSKSAFTKKKLYLFSCWFDLYTFGTENYLLF